MPDITLRGDDLGDHIATRSLKQIKGSDVASADSITLQADGNTFDVTGTTTINHITSTNWIVGSVMILHFDGAITLTNNAGGLTGSEANILLSGDVNYTTSAGDILTFLLHDSTNWQEISRNSNGVIADASITNAKLVTNPLARANHTGTQVASTVSDFDVEVANNSAVVANTAKVGITSAQASEITANTAKVSLDDNSVTLAKLAHGTADKYLGFDSSGNPEEKTVSAGGNNVIMQQDTTPANHTYSTTTTATAGETVNATVTAEGGFTDVPYMALGTSYTQRTLRTFATGRDITGILTLTAQAGGSGAYIHYDVWFTNTAGATIYTVSVQAVMSHGSQVKNFNFGALTDVKNIYWKGKNQYHPSYQGGMGIHTQSWTGTESAERDPVEMNSATNDGSGSSIYYASIETTNPFVTTDFGSSTRIASVAIMPRTQNTETIFQIQTSNDGSTWVTNRTILASSLTSWIYNYVKLTPVLARYVRIYGYSGASKVISFDEIKVKVGISDTAFLDAHYHKDISTTDTSLTLAGD